MTPFTRTTAVLASAGLSLGLASCAQPDTDPIRATGSATVEPITQLAAVESSHTVELSSDGTYDGFEAFCSGASDINNASAPITDEYAEQCAANGVDFIELPVAYDALSLVANVDNVLVNDLTLEEVQRIWEPDSEITQWSDVRPSFPQEDIALKGRPEGSGTFSFFTTTVNGEDGAIRNDYEATDDLEEMTQFIASNPYALGFMGVGNYLGAGEQERNSMKTLSIDGVPPSLENVREDNYSDLSRPLLIYVSTDSLEQNQSVEDFVESFLDNAQSLASRVYFYPLADEAQEEAEARWEARETGTAFGGGPVA